MPFPLFAAAARVLAGTGQRAATAALGKDFMQALTARATTGAAGNPKIVDASSGSMSEIIGRSRNFGNVLSGSRSGQVEMAAHDTAQQDRAAAEGAERRKQAEESLVKSAAVVTGGLVGLGVAVLKVPGMLEGWSRSVLAGQESLRKFNGQINNAFAKLEFQDIVRARNTANATSGSTTMLAEALNELGDNTAELKHAAITAMNLLGTIAAHVGSGIAIFTKYFSAIGALVELAALIERNTAKGDGQRIDNFFHDIAEGKFSGMKRDRITPREAAREPRK